VVRGRLQREEKSMRKLRMVTVLITVAALVAVLAIPAFAASKNCWGVVTSQRAVAVGDMGAHSSSFAGEPRLGLGNVARLFAFDHVSELGSFLATADEIDATSCD
jgi:hypothetical protein